VQLITLRRNVPINLPFVPIRKKAFEIVQQTARIFKALFIFGLNSALKYSLKSLSVLDRLFIYSKLVTFEASPK
jgi:hypothetical protein